MNIYLVRMSTDQQVVGVFAAEGVADLARLVDQACDPQQTEYLQLSEGGGFYVSGATNAQWPARKVGEDDFNQDDEHPLDGAVPTGEWWLAVQAGTWLPIGLTGFPPVDAFAV